MASIHQTALRHLPLARLPRRRWNGASCSSGQPTEWLCDVVGRVVATGWVLLVNLPSCTELGLVLSGVAPPQTLHKHDNNNRTNNMTIGNKGTNMFMVLIPLGSHNECSANRPKADLDCDYICRLLQSKPSVAIYYYYLAPKLILILLSHGGWKAELAGLHNHPHTVTHPSTKQALT